MMGALVNSPRAAHQENLPETQRKALKAAVLLSWLTIAYLLIDVVVLFLIKGNSQAMQAAWVQDVLALVPPVVFLIGSRVSARRATTKHPYGFHQFMDVAHFLAAASLLAFGGFLLGQSAMSLLSGQPPGIGLFSLFGFELWQGWVMIAVMAIGVVPPLILGRKKMRPAQLLHNQVLYTDSKMNKADWLSSLATIVGVSGVGLGIWWADAVAAIIISLDILWDGLRNLRASLSALTDSIPVKMDTGDRHPLPQQINRTLSELDWVKEAGCRVRGEGQVFHIEAFIIPEDPRETPIHDLIEARKRCLALDWKINDVVVVPVEELPSTLQTDVAPASW